MDTSKWVSAGAAFRELAGGGSLTVSRATFYRLLQQGRIPHREEVRPFQTLRRVQVSTVRDAMKERAGTDDE